MFHQDCILSIDPPVPDGAQLHLSWTSLPLGGFGEAGFGEGGFGIGGAVSFQVYVDEKLSYSGTATQCTVPMPSATAQISIGTVGPGEQTSDESDSLPMLPKARVDLEWTGGTFQGTDGDQDVIGFHVYGSTTPGGSIDYTTPLASIAAYVGGIVTDGFGMGGFGSGGFGLASGSYSWASGVLVSGTWSFGVTAYDSAGNESPPQTASVVIAVPPGPPTNLTYTLQGFGYGGFGGIGFGESVAVLTWQPSTG